jgi:hypothetical protein
VVLPVTVPAFTGLSLNGDTAEPAGTGVDGVEVLGSGEDLVRIITAPHHPHLLWVNEHLAHLSSHAQAIADPASRVAEQRRLPWWR